jgi:hypothetical protein
VVARPPPEGAPSTRRWLASFASFISTRCAEKDGG